MCMPDHGGQKRASDPLGLEFQWVPGTQLGPLVPLTTEPPPAPISLFLRHCITIPVSGTYYVLWTSLKVAILLPQLPECQHALAVHVF